MNEITALVTALAALCAALLAAFVRVSRELRRAREREPAASPPVTAPESRPSRSESPRRILLVDDDAGDARILEALLRPLNVQIIHVDSAEEAIEFLHREAVVLAIVDVRLSDYRGPISFRGSARKYS